MITIILCQFIWTGTNRKWGIHIFFVKITLMSFYLDWYIINDKNYFMSIYLDFFCKDNTYDFE